MGIRNYRILCSAMVVALFVAIAIPILSNKKDESFANSSSSDILLLEDDAVEIKFLNTQSDIDGNAILNSDGKKIGGNEANLIKTKNGKYVLIDTGDADPNGKIFSVIYKALDKYQNNGKGGKVTIDYLIISHSHSDHIGNAKAIISSDKIKVDNLVIKREGALMKKNSGVEDTFADIINACVKKECKNIYSNSALGQYGFIEGKKGKTTRKELTKEASKIDVDEYLSLYFYNTIDIYGDNRSKNDYRKDGYSDYVNSKDVCTEGYTSDLYSNKDKIVPSTAVLATKADKGDKYLLQLDNRSGGYPNAGKSWKLINDNTSLLNYIDNQNGLNRVFYTVLRTNKNGVPRTDHSCNPNGNSYGILAEVKPEGNEENSDNYKYIYFANDLDNFGYDVIPTKTNVAYYDYNEGLTYKQNLSVYGNGRGVIRKNTDLGSSIIGNRVASETRTALEIASQLGDNINNIVIYQQSHHGINDAPDVTGHDRTNANGEILGHEDGILNLNRRGIYAIANMRSNPTKQQAFVYLRSYYYALNMVGDNRLLTGIKRNKKSVNGVSCIIDVNGNTGCGYAKFTLEYKANGSANAPGNQVCFSKVSNTDQDYCVISIPKAQPTRSGYKFLGWSTSSAASTVTYQPGQDNIKISSNTTLYAVWQKQATYTLTYDANGGTGAPANQTCFAVNDGTCSLKVSSTTPTRSGYVFAGWDTVTTTLDGTYKPGSTITLNVPTRTLYAIWKRVVNVNTSVNGTGGRISSSMTGIEQGTTVTITFTPNAGYEIDNVKVDGETVTVTDNSIDVIVQDEDVNVVVTFKKKAVDPTPDDPTPDPTRTFRLSFSGANGGSGFPSAVTCTTTTDSCSVVIPSTPEPERTGYKFLGYGLFSNWSEVVATPGEQYTLTGNTSFLAIWAPDYKLTLDANGGEFPAGVETTLTCAPTTANGTCTVTLPDHADIPTRQGYEFFGYTISSNNSTAEYLPGQNYTFTAGVYNVTVYALWENSDTIEWIQGQDYTKGSDVSLILRINYPVNNFVALKIDNSIVNSSNYDVYSGSTIIAIHSDYTNTLADGEHTVQIVYSNNVAANTTFTVATITDENPDDGFDDDLDDGDPGEDDLDGPTDPDDPTNPDNPTPDNPDTPTDPDEPSPVDPDDPYNSDADEDEDDYIPVPSTSAGTPDTGENTGNNIGGNIAVMILPIALAGLATLAYKRNINKTHRKFD